MKISPVSPVFNVGSAQVQSAEARCGVICCYFGKEGDWLLRGYLQSERYFDRVAIAARFAPTPERMQRLQGKYGDWISRPHVTGISVRRGDYLYKAQWHPFVGKRYFVDALARLSEARDFIVCSDDIAWCKRWFPRRFPKKKFLFIEAEPVLDQLYLQALCCHNVISNSSFSWWGAWLNVHADKRVLAPSQWFGFAFRREGMDWSTIYADGWEIVPNRYTPARWVWGTHDLCLGKVQEAVLSREALDLRQFARRYALT